MGRERDREIRRERQTYSRIE
jgi:hypothetical protein